MDRHGPCSQRTQIVHGDGAVQGELESTSFQTRMHARDIIATCITYAQGGDLRQAISRSSCARATRANSGKAIEGNSVACWRADESKKHSNATSEAYKVLSVGIKLQWATQICEALEYLVRKETEHHAILLLACPGVAHASGMST